MPSRHDVLIVGLGAMGSAAAYHLARRGRRVLGLDRFHPPHAHGSSHGQTRIIREAYFEDPAYVPLIQRAYTLWQELARTAGRNLYLPTGGLMIGPPHGTLVQGARRSAQTHRLAYEELSATEIHARFPALQPPETMVGIWEPRAGILFPETAIEAHLTLAAQAGADLRFEDPVLGWSAQEDGVEVQTASGRHWAGQLILTCGSWLPQLWPAGRSLLQVERQILFWFSPRRSEPFQPDRCPVHIWEHAPGHFFYGFPDLGQGAKMARHGDGESTHPDQVRRAVTDEEKAELRALVARYLPDLDVPCREAAVCLYTNTPDHHFLLDRHPEQERVWLVSPCSGHGFKFASVVGETLAQLACGEHVPLELERFKLQRFRAGEGGENRAAGSG